MHILWDGWGDGTPMNLQKLVTLLLIITTFKKSLIFLLPNIKQIIIKFFFSVQTSYYTFRWTTLYK